MEGNHKLAGKVSQSAVWKVLSTGPWQSRYSESEY